MELFATEEIRYNKQHDSEGEEQKTVIRPRVFHYLQALHLLCVGIGYGVAEHIVGDKWVHKALEISGSSLGSLLYAPSSSNTF